MYYNLPSLPHSSCLCKQNKIGTLCKTPLYRSMKSSVCLPKNHILFQSMTSLNSLCQGKFKSFDHTKISYPFETLGIEMK